MSAFTCQRCSSYCCTCSGCHQLTAADGTIGCTRCNPAYEQNLVQQTSRLRILTGIPQNINRPRNVFTDNHGLPQISYKR